MTRKNLRRCVGRCLLFAGVILAFPGPARAVSRFQDITSQKLNPGTGTVEFRVRMLKDISADPHNHVLLLGVATGGAENCEIELIKDTIIARRYWGGCFLTAFSRPHNFKRQDWHDLKLTWNKASTKFYVDGRDVEKIGPLSTDDITKMIPGLRLGREDDCEIQDLQVSAETSIRADSEDLAFVEKTSCPRLDELLNERAQEESRGIPLHHFPDQKARDMIKTYIALLPGDFVREIHHVIFVPKERASGRGEGGLADLKSGSIMLEEKYYADPAVFFHEAAHIYDNKLHIASGVPGEKSEWAKISGVFCYYKGTGMKQFAEDFSKTHVKNGFLGGQGGECPPEDLAEWVGAVYEYYLTNKSFADMLDPANVKYSAKNQKKLDFLLKKGFFSQKIYDTVTAW